jgi:molybdopterin/thiamine biosynthesis adenylyltransferase
MIYCSNLDNSAQMLYYLTAMGVGHIQCQAKETHNSDALLKRLSNLNPDVNVYINSNNAFAFDAVILCLENDNIDIPIKKYNSIPTILAAATGDRGLLKTAVGKEALSASINKVSHFLKANSMNHPTLFNKTCKALLGNLAAAEAVKAILNIGTLCEEGLQFDLFTYEFTYGANLSEPEEYSFDIEQQQNRLQNAKALVIGSGGLGSPVAYMLAAMGIGTLGLVDYDTVELSNLNRQILHSTDKIGMPKVQSAKEFLHNLNPGTQVIAQEMSFTKSNSLELINDYDVVLDALDNLETRYILNDACYSQNKTLIEAGVLGFNGLATNITADKGHCYRCIFPMDDGKNPVPS